MPGWPHLIHPAPVEQRHRHDGGSGHLGEQQPPVTSRTPWAERPVPIGPFPGRALLQHQAPSRASRRCRTSSDWVPHRDRWKGCRTHPFGFSSSVRVAQNARPTSGGRIAPNCRRWLFGHRRTHFPQPGRSPCLMDSDRSLRLRQRFTQFSAWFAMPVADQKWNRRADRVQSSHRRRAGWWSGAGAHRCISAGD
jgi:hypothetical protein